MLIDQSQVDDLLNSADNQLISAIPYSYARRHHVLILNNNEDHDLVVLTSGDTNISSLTEVRRKFDGQSLKILKTDATAFQTAISQAYEKSGGSEASQMASDIDDEFDLNLLSQDITETTDLLEASDNAPVVKLLNALMSQAVREHVSDIHLEAYEKDSVVRFRSDGVLKDVIRVKRALHMTLVSRLKVMAKLDIAEKRLPQDGRISIRLGERPIDIRVSTLPTQHGERVVLRLLDKQASAFNVKSLGMDEALEKRYNKIIRQPHGIVLVTGPTGSGKTTTLYAGLHGLDRQKLNVLTVEDPVEYDLAGISQTQVQTKIGMTFAAGLRSILRQDPDVVLVGEIRDLETAQIAVQASLTGHLVLSTLHTNTAIGAITRLVDMGVEPFLIASSLSAVLAQRLVRKLCDECKEEREATESEKKTMGVDLDEEIKIFDPVGCDVCEKNGYKGRTGVYEFILIDETLRKMIHDDRSEADMLTHVRKGVPSISQYGFGRVMNGETSLEEILRVTLEQSTDLNEGE